MKSFGMVGKLTTGAAAVAVACVGVFAAAPAATAASTTTATADARAGISQQPFVIQPQINYGGSAEAQVGDTLSIPVAISNLSTTDFETVVWQTANSDKRGESGRLAAGQTIKVNVPYTVTAEDLANGQVEREIIVQGTAKSVRTQQSLWVGGVQVHALASPATLKASANGKYVVAEHEGAGSLIANRVKAGPCEQFTISYNSDNTVSLKAGANGKFVTAEDGGARALIANRTAVGPWEKFYLIRNADSTFSLQSVANGEYVTAEDGGASALIANRTAIGPWEKFTFTF